MLADANPYVAAPSFLNSGDTAWQLTAATFVGMQSLPGLAILYAAVVKKKWALNSAVMCFYAFAVVLLVWVLWGYNMSFGRPLPIPGPSFLQATVGVPAPAALADAELGRANIPLVTGTTADLRFSGSAMIYFQFVFAAITPILIAGGVLARMNFKAWMLFVPLWTTFVYSVGAFSLWGGGWLAQLGAVNYSGGYVIHLAAGVSGFVAAAVVGPRLLEDRTDFEPNNLIMALAGAGILWLGWNGFNGGDPYIASADAAAAVLNTNIATDARPAELARARHDGDRQAERRVDDQRRDRRARRNHAVRGLRERIRRDRRGTAGRNARLVQHEQSRQDRAAKTRRRHARRFPYARRRRIDRRPVRGNLRGPEDARVSQRRRQDEAGVGDRFALRHPHQFWVQLFAALVIIGFDAAATFGILKAISLVVPLRASDTEVEGGDLAIHVIDPVPVYAPPVTAHIKAPGGAPAA